MNDVRDRSHRLNRVDGIARHGRLRRHRPFSTAAKVLAGAVAVALVSTASVAAIAAKQVTDDFGEGVRIQGQSAAPRPQQQAGPTLSAFEGGFTMLVVGTDNDPEQGTQYGERDATLNDVNILVHVSADHTNATAVSIPRDLVTPIPACAKPDGSGSTPARAAAPINDAWGEGGLNCVVQTVQGLTGLDVQYSAAVSFNGVIEMSNAIGGVPVCVASPIHDRYTGLDLPAGTTTLQGSQALEFLRTRHGVGDGSDLGRISSQQVFLSSLLRTVRANSTLTSPATLYKLARAAASNMQLSESLNDPRTLVGMGRALQDLPLDRVNFVQYPGTTGGTGVYDGKVQPTTELADELFARIKADESFSLGAGSTGIGSESAPANPSPADPTPGAPAPTAPTPTVQPPAAQTPAASTPGTPAATGTPDAPATADTLDGLQGQSAAQQTCSKAFGS